MDSLINVQHWSSEPRNDEVIYIKKKKKKWHRNNIGVRFNMSNAKINSLFIIYYLLFIIYYSIIYHLLFIIYYLLFIIYYLLFIIYNLLFIIFIIYLFISL